MPALPREFADRYQIRSPIGEGAFSVTYRAVDKSLQRDVAIKVLREQYAAHEGFDSRFEREARAAARISHPNVISVYDYGRQGTMPYIVMQFVDGPNLKEYVREEGPLTIEEALNFARQILDGLAAIHDENIIHRDVKPQNVLIDEGLQAKITDFGVAFVTRDPGLTETGMAVGTAAYMAPEQASGEVVGPPTDLYAVGVILYEMLTGRLPFAGDNPVQVMYRHVNELPRPLRSLNNAVPLAVEAVVLRALAKDPDDRFTDARTMRNALLNPGSGSAETIAVKAVAPASVTDTDQHPYVARDARQYTSAPRRRAAAPPPPSTWPIVLLIFVILGLIGVLWLLLREEGLAGQVGDLASTPTAQVEGSDGPDPTSAPAEPKEEIQEEPTSEPEPVVVEPTATPEPEATATPEPEATATPTEEPPPPTEEPEEPPPVDTEPPSARFDTPFGGENLPPLWVNGTTYVNLTADELLAGGASEPSDEIGFPGAEVWDQVDVEFTALDDPSQYIGVVITAMNTPQEGQTPMRLLLNGNQIWTGPSPFPEGEWAEIAWSVGNLGWLSEGTSVLTIQLQGSTGTILVSNVTIYYG